MILGIDDPLWKVLSDVFLVVIFVLVISLLAFLIAWLCAKSKEGGTTWEKYYLKPEPEGYSVIEWVPVALGGFGGCSWDKKTCAHVDTIQEGRKIIHRLKSRIEDLEKEEDRERDREIQAEMHRIGQEKMQERKAQKQKKITTYKEWADENNVPGMSWKNHQRIMSEYLEYLTKELRKEIHNEY